MSSIYIEEVKLNVKDDRLNITVSSEKFDTESI